jgi:hypothetical protein
MKESRLFFDTIHIIESLTSRDLRTGRRLFEDLGPLADAATPQATVRFDTVYSRANFLDLLGAIAEEARRHSHSPILHIEAHGSSAGIQVSSGECLSWMEFKAKLIAINEISQLNLLVILAACKGAYLLSTLYPRDRAPMRALIGPIRSVSTDEIERANLAFYRRLFDARDIVAAWDAMNDAVAPEPTTFLLFSAEKAFLHVMSGYFATYCSEDALARRENQAKIRLEQDGTSGEDLERNLQEFRCHIRDRQSLFEECKKKFFFCDLYPQNTVRFGVTLEDCTSAPHRA